MFDDYIKSQKNSGNKPARPDYAEDNFRRANSYVRKTHMYKKSWTKEQCTAVARKYTSLMKFHDNEIAAYTAAWKNGWLKDFTWLNRRSHKYPLDERVIRNDKDKVKALLGDYMFYSMANLLGEETVLTMARMDDELGIFGYDPIELVSVA